MLLKLILLLSTASIVTRFSPTNVNLHKPFQKVIKSAGLKPSPKLIQNLRASCETEWLDSGFPAHVVANRIGHSVQVQNESYAQVDDHHFEKFNEAFEDNVAHMVAQQRVASSGTDRRLETPETVEKAEWSPKKARSKDRAFCPG